MQGYTTYIQELLPPGSKQIPDFFHETTIDIIKKMLRIRDPFAHKGDFGSGGLIAGSYGMMGAATLSALAFMRSGGGKLTCHIPAVGYVPMQVSVPEAMAKVEPGKTHILSVSPLKKYDVLGIGPGLGVYPSYIALLEKIFLDFQKPLVIDADGLNNLAGNKKLLKKIPLGSVITPHPKEFERLFGATGSEWEKIALALDRAKTLKIIIVLKGHFTLVATPTGKACFNTTGNAGMATGGAGDVLTGIITGLIAQQYAPEEAAILGVYLHGLAGDLAAKKLSEEALIAGDLIGSLGDAFRCIHEMP